MAGVRHLPRVHNIEGLAVAPQKQQQRRRAKPTTPGQFFFQAIAAIDSRIDAAADPLPHRALIHFFSGIVRLELARELSFPPASKNKHEPTIPPLLSFGR